MLCYHPEMNGCFLKATFLAFAFAFTGNACLLPNELLSILEYPARYDL